MAGTAGFFTEEARATFRTMDRVIRAVQDGTIRQVSPEKHDDYREELAALCHTQWAGWTDHLLGKGRRNEDGSVTLAAGYVTALNRLIHLSYADLTEAEKDSDRKEADRILALR